MRNFVFVIGLKSTFGTLGELLHAMDNLSHAWVDGQPLVAKFYVELPASGFPPDGRLDIKETAALIGAGMAFHAGWVVDDSIMCVFETTQSQAGDDGQHAA